MKLQDLITTRFSIGFALLVARCCTPGLGHSIADFIAHRFADRKSSELVRSMRANLWVVSGGQMAGPDLDRMVRHVLRNAGRSMYDFYHSLNKPNNDDRLVSFDDATMALLERMRDSTKGIVVVAPHLSNFDLAVRRAVRTGIQTQILTINNGVPAYQMQDLLRRNPNLDVTPASLQALKKAAQRLDNGGSVITGIDRPLPESRYKPRFFGRRTALPVHHIYLALKTETPISVIHIHHNSDGLYHVGSSEPITLKHYPNPADEIIHNAEHILEIAADYICQAPEQWSMFHPVWPEAIAELEESEVPGQI